jgi:ribonuclease III
MKSELHVLELELGYRFTDQALVRQAVTHPSFENERAGAGDYQRLEFLGDAVLGMVLAETLYARFPESDEGILSRLRSQIVDQDTLAVIARGCGLGRFILLGRGEEHGSGCNKDSILADVVEALIAAVYLDGGLEPARMLIERWFDNVVEARESALKINDAKSELQELISARRLQPPHYRLCGETGPPHDRLFRFQVMVGDEVVGEGEGRSKKIAQQAAATQALNYYEEGASPAS